MIAPFRPGADGSIYTTEYNKKSPGKDGCLELIQRSDASDVGLVAVVKTPSL